MHSKVQDTYVDSLTSANNLQMIQLRGSTTCLMMKRRVTVFPPWISVFISDALTHDVFDKKFGRFHCIISTAYHNRKICNVCVGKTLFPSHFQTSTLRLLTVLNISWSLLSSLSSYTAAPHFQPTVYCSLQHWALYMTGSCVLKTPLPGC